MSLALAGEDCHVTAVDIDSELVAAVRRQAGELDLPVDAIAADARSLELDASFDLILAPMQVAQLLGDEDRAQMLSSIARHLHPDGEAAVALLDLDEEWEADGGALPPPDVLEKDGWVYSSQPVAVRRVAGDNALSLDRVRRVISPKGEQTETFFRICLELFPRLAARGGGRGRRAQTRSPPSHSGHG